MRCPECGARDTRCQSRFDEFLVLEFTDAGYDAVHHLTVAAFMIQHSSRLTREGWLFERDLLRAFLVDNRSPDSIRDQYRDLVDSSRRKFKIISRTGVPVLEKSTWSRTILDVDTENAQTYREGIRLWAGSVLDEAQRLQP